MNLHWKERPGEGKNCCGRSPWQQSQRTGIYNHVIILIRQLSFFWSIRVLCTLLLTRCAQHFYLYTSDSPWNCLRQCTFLSRNENKGKEDLFGKLIPKHLGNNGIVKLQNARKRCEGTARPEPVILIPYDTAICLPQHQEGEAPSPHLHTEHFEGVFNGQTS